MYLPLSPSFSYNYLSPSVSVSVISHSLRLYDEILVSTHIQLFNLLIIERAVRHGQYRGRVHFP